MEPSAATHRSVIDMSPALTNPDMILPCPSQFSSQTSSPSPPSSDHTPSSFLQANQHKHVPSRPEHSSGSMIHSTGASSPMGQAESSIGFLRPSLPGAWQTEEDFRTSNGPAESQAIALGLSPALHRDDLGVSPSAACFEQGHGGQWKGFDTGEIGNGIDPCSDMDLESPIDEDTSDVIRLDDGRNSIRAILEEDENDPSSHAALSIKAERILATAKKRLLEMEDNLSRARRTLKDTSPPRLPAGELNAKQPVSIFGTPEDKSKWKSMTANHSKDNSPNSAGKTAGHSRVFSETAVPDFSARPKHDQDPQRSSSAIGSVNTNPSARNHWNYRTNGSIITHNPPNRKVSTTVKRKELLGPLHEDDGSYIQAHDRSKHGSSRLEKSGHRYGNSNTSYFNTKQTEPREVTRSRSTVQLRDLREQMEDLKGKVTSLKLRTREDRLQRRSLQALKTPSPFTVAQDWREDSDGKGQDVWAGGVRHHMEASLPSHQPAKSLAADDLVRDGENLAQVHENNGIPGFSESLEHAYLLQEETGREPAPLTEITDFEEATGRENEGTPNSFNTISPSEGTPSTVGARHEDRPDAFDYEHFFLHSSMGSFGPSGLARNLSQSSSDSAETTKPSNEEIPMSVPKSPSPSSSLDRPPDGAKTTLHARQPSKDSTPTAGALASAAEDSHRLTEQELNSNRQNIVPSSTAPHLQSTLQDPTSQFHAQEMHPNGNGNSSAQKEKDYKVQNGTYLYPSSSKLFHHHRHHQQSDSFSSSTSSLTKKSVPPSGSALSTLNLLSSDTAKLGRADQASVGRLLGSLHVACQALHDNQFTDDEGGDVVRRHEGQGTEGRKVWRRKIDAARRILDGEINLI